MGSIKIAPSVLSADMANLKGELDKIAGADYVHFDVMDGHFTGNLTFGVDILKAVKRSTDVPVDAHLMVSNPDETVDWYADAGADMITVHYEASTHLHRTLTHLQQRGVKAGVVLNPATPVCVLESIIDVVDMVLLMSVNPGFGDQSFIPGTLHKLHELKAMCERHGVSPLIEVDGGISSKNIAEVVKAGANVLVAGSAVFKSEDPAAEVALLQKLGNEAAQEAYTLMTVGQNRIPVNLDYAASTPMRAEALLAQREYDDSELAGVNPNSLHSLGRKAAARLEVARREIARSFGARVRPSEIILTNGGTEANQLALLGLAEGARQHDRKRSRVIVSAIEHDSILDNLPLLRAAGFTVDLVQPCRAGYIEPAALSDLLGDDVALVSIMAANNETGVVQPIRELATAAHAVGALFHTDAIQGYLHIPLDATELGVDAMSVAAHKIGGPVASGALYVKTRTPLRPRIFGGGQEAGRRAGTQDLRTQLAFAAAASVLLPNVGRERATLQALSDKLYATLTAHPRIHATMGDYTQADRLPGMVSIYIDGMDSEELIIKLDAAGFEVSAGSACSSGSMDPSHVLSAMGIGREQALGALRISFDDRVNPGDLDDFAQTLLSIVGAV